MTTKAQSLVGSGSPQGAPCRATANDELGEDGGVWGLGVEKKEGRKKKKGREKEGEEEQKGRSSFVTGQLSRTMCTDATKINMLIVFFFLPPLQHETLRHEFGAESGGN